MVAEAALPYEAACAALSKCSKEHHLPILSPAIVKQRLRRRVRVFTAGILKPSVMMMSASLSYLTPLIPALARATIRPMASLRGVMPRGVASSKETGFHVDGMIRSRITSNSELLAILVEGRQSHTRIDPVIGEFFDVGVH